MPVKTTLFSLIAVSVCFLLQGQDEIFIEPLANGFNTPVDIAHSGDERLFIVEKRGIIRIMDTTGQVLPDVFLNIDPKVSSNGERGLLGLAFHPQYAENREFYLNYTNNSGNTVIARYQRDSVQANLADPNSEEILLTINQPFSNHNAGDLAFGPDGYLYVGTGDGGNGGDPGDRGQNTMELLGKMLRLDVDSSDTYRIPPDNPFVEVDTILDEIWAIGLRNPWRYSFDRMTGDFYIADVGQNAFEEVNFQLAGSTGGQNYGWRCYEADNPFNTQDCLPEEAFTRPVFSYPHEGVNCGGSITGGYVYRGTQYPDLFGTYICVDYCRGVFRAFSVDSAGNAVDGREVLENTDESFLSFGEDASGEMYLASGSGTIFKVGSTVISSVTDVADAALSLFPNPASNSISFVVDTESGFDTGEARVDIYDTSGRHFMSRIARLSQPLDVSTLENGAYIMKVAIGGEILSARFTIIR